MYKIKKNKKIATRNRFGQENGYLVSVVDIEDGFLPRENFPHHVYLTVVNPGEVKGPHYHKQRYAMYTCIKGNVKVVIKLEGKYKFLYSGEKHDYATIWVEAGIPTAIVNLESDEASFVLNTPNPSYLETSGDDFPVEFDPAVLGK